MAQQSHGAFNPARHEVRVDGFAVGGFELSREVPSRHVDTSRERVDVERLLEFSVDAIAHPTQRHQVCPRSGALWHGASVPRH